MKLPYYGLTFLIGIVLTVHLAMNGKVGAVLDNPRVGNALFWCVGAVAALLIGLSGWQAGALKPLRDAQPRAAGRWSSGCLLVFGIAFLIPRIGAAKLTLIMLSGHQDSRGPRSLSNFGWLGFAEGTLSRCRNIRGSVGHVCRGDFLATL